MTYDPDFDGQRLALHPRRVAEWLEHGITRGPIFTEMELTTVCQHHCSFCGVDHLVNRQRVFINPALAVRILNDLAECGNLSVHVSGHGEPLLHPDAAAVLRHAASLMSTALTTNGVLYDEHDPGLMDGLKWLRFSVNGGDPETYARIHGTSPRAFERALANIETAVRRKRDLGLACVVGTQIVLLEENAQGVVGLARLLRQIGVDYFSVKPYSQHPLSTPRKRPEYRNIADLEEELRSLETASFRVHVRKATVARLGREKDYGRCHGTHFSAFVGADISLWACSVFSGDERFYIGDLSRESVASLWTGERRREVLRFIEEDLDLGGCRDVCRMDACNRYLWRLKHPLAHDDFI